jgi:DNA-binding NtrC family response regulator
VVAATNYNLTEAVKSSQFRQDLYYRLNVVAIQLPPLRQRKEDIPLLANHFLKHYSAEDGKTISTISDKAMDLLASYPWPGNIRELENAIEQAVALSFQPVLTPEDLPPDVREQAALSFRSEASQDGQFLLAGTPSLEEVRKRYVLHVLERTQGNVSATARILNVDRRSLYRMLARYKIEPFLKED